MEFVRPAARQHVDELKVGERDDEGEDHHDDRDRLDHRQGDVPELPPAARAVDLGRVVRLGRDSLEGGEEGDGEEDGVPGGGAEDVAVEELAKVARPMKAPGCHHLVREDIRAPSTNG